MIQVKEFADELIDSVPGFHLDIHCKKECKKKLKQKSLQVTLKLALAIFWTFFGGLLHRARQVPKLEQAQTRIPFCYINTLPATA